MRYSIRGADHDTGQDMEITIDAPSESAARDIALKKGMMVAVIVPAQTAHARQQTPPQYHPRLESGHVRGAPIVNIAPPRRGSSLGVAAIVLGVLAFLVCWIPVINIAAVLLGGLGLLLGLVGTLIALGRRGSGIGLTIAGSAICGLAVFVAIGMNVAIMEGIKNVRQATSPSAGVPRTGESGTPAAPTAPPEIEWNSAEDPARLGDIEVSITSTRVGKVELRDFGSTATSSNELLQITLSITNRHPSKKLSYDSWRGATPFSKGIARLADNFGNTYKRVEFGLTSEIVGSVRTESLYPGIVIKDVLVFEPPVGEAYYLDLELPGQAIGETGILRFRIPVGLVEH